jgi:surfeit locus 1 family protein
VTEPVVRRAHDDASEQADGLVIRPRRRVLFAVSWLLLAVVFAALGGWQVERRAWKLGLIRRIDARVHAAPVAMPLRDGQVDGAYRHVTTRGVFVHDAETLVRASTQLGPGWWVMTPLRTVDGTVLVNRGFVPPERRGSQTRRKGDPAGMVTVTGLLRTSEPGGSFLHGNDPSAGRWYSRDVAAIARARGVGRVALLFLDADATPNRGGYPIGGLTVIAFSNNHLSYALTWFALAGLSLAAGVLLLRAKTVR